MSIPEGMAWWPVESSGFSSLAVQVCCLWPEVSNVRRFQQISTDWFGLQEWTKGIQGLRCKDPKFMPKEKSCWSAWNGLNLPSAPAVVTYWINKLQPGACTEDKDVFVTLNPPKDSSWWVREYLILHSFRIIHQQMTLSAGIILVATCRDYGIDDQEDHWGFHMNYLLAVSFRVFLSPLPPLQDSIAKDQILAKYVLLNYKDANAQSYVLGWQASVVPSEL